MAEEQAVTRTLDSLRTFRVLNFNLIIHEQAGYKLQEATWMFLVNVMATK